MRKYLIIKIVTKPVNGLMTTVVSFNDLTCTPRAGQSEEQIAREISRAVETLHGVPVLPNGAVLSGTTGIGSGPVVQVIVVRTHVE